MEKHGGKLIVKVNDYSFARRKMVQEQLSARGIKDERVLAAMTRVPRHRFVEEGLWSQAYGDFPLPIGEGQTISQPYIVALMTQALQLQPDDKVLEIGTGSGYQVAVVAEIARRVFSVERISAIAARARKILDELRYSNVLIKIGDGTAGWPEEAPFDAVIVTAGAPGIPEPLLGQLATGGRMVIPVGDMYSQELVKIVKTDEGYKKEDLGGCRFVKLVGAHGWKEGG